ncbi:uncharacterized protein AMSG_09938 [Thecamonas trahens ATCC 50062]|uniref:Uncharacterized protein n=1 Tax=Thecamonas trahens ATCC 50062 TaxID=461836 RepID=A0A0L0DRV5_THETB|nr:hypothetical protein AMSG_09938 [Thecamonas trahens ATCC 50062]KNC54158.1 hypothetical protein AMSG_09938 [Thecamonas trahens ATCC 50062]|eukprot:XP_013753979.1 hypothetical protein AMSG_09938 [Thecamonas trahens ATCC 50062]
MSNAAAVAAVAGTAWAANSGPLLEPSLRVAAWLASRLSPHPLRIEFDSAEGTLLLPRTELRLDHLRVTRTPEGASRDIAAGFDLVAARVDLVAARGMATPSGAPVIESLHVSGLSGTVRTAPHSPPLPHVVIGHARLDHAALVVDLHTHQQNLPLPLVVKAAEIRDLDIADVPASLALARLQGLVDGVGTFHLTSGGADADVELALRNIPLVRVSAMAPAGSALEWLSRGGLDLGVQAKYVYDPINPSRLSHVTLRVSSRLFDLAADIPASRRDQLAPSRLAAVRTFVAYVNSHSRAIDLAYTVRVTPAELRDALAECGESRTRAFVTLFLRALSTELFRSAGSSLLEGLSALVDRARQ